MGRDFLEAGDQVLRALGFESLFTWNLAQEDMFGSRPRFTTGPESPFVFTLCGNRNYGKLHDWVTAHEGSDGTVRWAGCALNSRKVEIDLMVHEGNNSIDRYRPGAWSGQANPLILVDGLNHGTVMSKPNQLLRELVKSALEVATPEEFDAWNHNAVASGEVARRKVEQWQQFIVRVVDERGDPVRDWNLQLYCSEKKQKPIKQFALDVHPNGADPSFRCFHVNLSKLGLNKLERLHLGSIALCGTRLVAYHGIGSDKIDAEGRLIDPAGTWDAQLDLSHVLNPGADAFKLFYPFTTTFIQICLNREPLPMKRSNEVFAIKRGAAVA